MFEEYIKCQKVRQRLNLIRSVKKYGVSVACERMGRHRSYYYYWLSRFNRYGVKGLEERSRRPKRMPKKTPGKLEGKVVRMRKRTGYGKERLHEYLKDKGVIIPISTIGSILKRRGLLIKKRKWKTAKKHIKRYDLLYPGQRVQMDIKYVPYKVKGKQWYQYTVIDEHTRMRYLEWHDSIWVLTVVAVLKRAREFFGFKIDSVQTDNGIEFTFDYTAQLTATNKDPVVHPLDRYCDEVGIIHKLIPPGQKEINGKVERSHRTDDEEFYRRYKKFKTLKDLRQYGRQWMYEYNFQRKHWGIARKTPGNFCLERLQMFPKRIAA